jgi:glutamyl-Q tRNA(Asp) synthetase
MDLIYPSFESRSEIAALVAERQAQDGWPCDPDGVLIYPDTSKHLTQAERIRRMATEPYALRLDVNKAAARFGFPLWQETGAGPNGETGIITATPSAWGDVVLARRETPTSYHLSVVIDDAAQGVTHVVRGQDLFWATSVHRLLQAILGLPEPTYHHHRLVRDNDGRKLSKSTRATSLRELRAQGMTPVDIRRLISLV